MSLVSGTEISSFTKDEVTSEEHDLLMLGVNPDATGYTQSETPVPMTTAIDIVETTTRTADEVFVKWMGHIELQPGSVAKKLVEKTIERVRVMA